MFKQFQNLVRGQNKPEELLKQMTNKYTPEQLQQFKKFASGFGVTEDQLNKYINK